MYQLMVNWQFGLVVWDSTGVPPSNNSFHKGIPSIQTTGPQSTNFSLAELGIIYGMIRLTRMITSEDLKSH